jgi:7,8-dihydropterin-6-yl-methyl-4-(beta-D-ribofuranosyl)aminobenzene 5'-phosphate synthase
LTPASSPDGLIENMRRLEHDVEVVVLSHGHFDHTTGMDGLIRTRGKANVPVLIHPEFWSRRRLAFPGRDPLMLPTTSRSALEGAGFEINEQQQPSLLRRVAAGHRRGRPHLGLRARPCDPSGLP